MRKYRSGVQLRILKLIEYANRENLEYVTVSQLEDETNLPKRDIQQAIYELHKKGVIEKPENSSKFDGKWRFIKGPYDKTLICKHLKKLEEDRYQCKITRKIFADPEISCNVFQFWDGKKLTYEPKCKAFEKDVSNHITMEISKNMIRHWEAIEIGHHREQYGNILDPESRKFLPNLLSEKKLG